MYRRRVVEFETEAISDYVSTPTPCGRHWLAVQPQSPHFTLHSLIPPLAQVGNSFPRFSLLLCTPLAGFQYCIFFLQSHDPSFVLYHSQIVVTEFSCSQSRPVPVPGPVQTKSSLPSRAKQKKVVTCGPLFFPLACGIGIRLTNVPSSAEQKGCMGLTLSRNGFGRRGETLSRIPDTWKMYGGWPPSSLTHGKTERDAV